MKELFSFCVVLIFAAVWCSQKFAFRAGDLLMKAPANFWVTNNRLIISPLRGWCINNTLSYNHITVSRFQDLAESPLQRNGHFELTSNGSLSGNENFSQ